LLRVKIFCTTDRWLKKIANGILSIHRAFWLGFLDRPALQAVTDEYYSEPRCYSDESYNLSGLFPWETEALDRFYGDCHSILVAASGGGREVIALSRLNYQIEAFECSEALVRVSRLVFAAQDINSRVVHALPDQVPQELGVYDGIIIGFAAYMHIGGRENRIQFLSKLRLHIRPGSPILISFFERGSRLRYFKTTFMIAKNIRRLRRSAESVEYGDVLDPNFLHRFTQAEVAEEMASGGFQLVYAASNPNGHVVGLAL